MKKRCMSKNKKNLRIMLFVMIFFLFLCVGYNKTYSEVSIDNFKYVLYNFGDLKSTLNPSIIGFNSSFMKSKTVKSAVDEIYNSMVNGCYVGYTKTSETGGTYRCSKATPDAVVTTEYNAKDVQYNNGTSKLSATNLEDAIIEVAVKVQYCKVQENYTKINGTNSYDCKKSITITAKDQTINYGASLNTGANQVIADTLANGDTVYSVTLTPSISNVGTGTITPSNVVIKNSSNQDVTNTYTIAYVKGTLTIDKSAATFTCNDYNYDGKEKTGCTCSGCTMSGTNKSTNAGSWEVTATPDSNHTLSTTKKTWKINKVAATFSCSDYTYDGKEKTGCTCTGCTMSGTNKSTNAGSWEVTATADGNHTLSTTKKTWKINKATASITCNSAVNWDGNPKKSYSTSSNCQSITNDYVTNAGTHTVTCNGGTNYTSPTCTFTINKAAATFSCSDYNYDGTEKTGCTCTGCTMSGTNKSTNVGSWEVTATADSNHTLSTTKKSWKINKVVGTFTCSDYTYDGTEKTGCTCTGCTMSGTNKSTNAGGPWTVTATADGNHYLLNASSQQVTTLSKTWKINKATASITCNSAVNWDGSSKKSYSASSNCQSITNDYVTNADTYTVTCNGGNNYTSPTCTFTINKVAATFNCSDYDYDGKEKTGCTCTGCTMSGTNKSTNVGSWEVTATADGNHTLSTTKKTWKINKVAATFNCSDYDYDGKEKTGCTCTGCTMSGTNKATNAGGPWEVTATADGNHTLSTTKKTWKINKVAATFSCSDYTYDGKEKTGCTCTGCTMSGTNKATNAGGPWEVTATADGNHTLSTTKKSWKINKAAASITCNAGVIYDTKAHDTVKSSSNCSSFTNSSVTNAGTYTVTCNGGTNYTSPTCSYTISKAAASITCKSAQNYSGNAITAYSSSSNCQSYTNGSPTNAGTYTVTCNGGTNYTSPTCSFTINKVAASITCANRTYNGNNQNMYSAATGCKSIDNGSQKTPGTWTLKCNQDDNHNTSPTCSATMDKAAASFSCSDYTYDGKEKTGCSCTNCTMSGTNKATNAGGAWTVTATVSNSSYYYLLNGSTRVNSLSKTWKINKAAASITCNAGVTYDTKPHSTVKSSSHCASFTNSSVTDAGTYTVTCNGETNYTSPTCSYTVSKAAASITCNAAVTYNDTSSYYSAVKSSSNCVDGITNEKPTNAGTYTVTCNGGKNYTSPTCSFTVNKTAASITCANRTYNGNNQNMYSAAKGCKTITNGSQKTPGSWTLTCNPDDNHNTSPKCSATMGYGQSSVTCRATRTYDTKAYTVVTGSSNCASLKIGDTAITTSTTRTDAGSYTVTCTGNTYYNNSTCTHTVNKATGSVSNPGNQTFVCAGSVTKTITTTGTLSCGSSDTYYILCSTSGNTLTVTGNQKYRPKSVTITLTSAEAPNYNKATTTFTATTSCKSCWKYQKNFSSATECSKSVNCKDYCSARNQLVWGCSTSKTSAPAASATKGQYCWCSGPNADCGM